MNEYVTTMMLMSTILDPKADDVLFNVLGRAYLRQLWILTAAFPMLIWRQRKSSRTTMLLRFRNMHQ